MFKIVNLLLVVAIVVKNLWDAYWLFEEPEQLVAIIISDDYCVILGWLSLIATVFILLPYTYVTGYLLTIYKIINLIAFYIIEGKPLAILLEMLLLVVTILLIRYGHCFSKRYLWNDMTLEDGFNK
ncbi:hypothetical protein [Flavobacterium sp. CAU 1735]|uniref:hypothetical protein n=1 Tax=Flavobacterium sp. CAU 1735 TaxID=3140361 RepID=UPI003261558A